MGSFSENAIGFFLEIEASQFSSTLTRAEKDYDRLVKALERHNKKAFESSTRGIGAVQDLVDAMAELPERATAAMRKAQGKLARAIKPVAMKVDLQLSSRAKGTLRAAVREAVGDALAGTKVRLTASRPRQRLAMFDNTLSLRAQYERLPQPPDMIGRLQPRKYATGGVVEGPQRGFDSVLALLQPGEMVLPKDAAAKLQEMAGAAIEGAGGEFVNAEELGKAFSEVENLARGLEKLKGVIDSGFGTKSDMEAMQRGVAELSKRTFALDDAFNELSFTSKVRLSPAIEQVHNRMGDLIDKTKDAAPPAERLLQQILGPARFLAVNKALGQVNQTFNELKDGGQKAFTTIGGQATIGSAIDNINEMNQFLGASRERLREIKDRAFESADALRGVGVDQLTAGLREAARLGIRDEEVMFRLAESATLAAQGMNVPMESAIDLGFELTQSIGLTDEAFQGVLATMGTLSDETSGFNISAGELFEQTRNDVTALGSSLRQLSDDEAGTLLNTFNRLGAVMKSNFIDAGPEIRQTLAKAFEGGPENMEAVQQATLLTGMGIDELRDRLKRGDIEGVFNGIAEATQGMGTEQLNAFARQVGVASADVSKFQKVGVEGLNAALVKSGTLITDETDAMEVLTERALNTKTAFQQGAEGLRDWLFNLSLGGVKVGEVADLTKEFNASTLLSIGFLAKWGAQGVVAAGKLGGKLLPVLGKIGGFFGKKGGGALAQGVGKVATAVGGGGATAGLFGGLGTGLTALAGGITTIGTVLLSPPGIAFTVSFVAALLALGGAARLAAPALEIVADVAMHAIDGVVTVATALLALEPRKMLAAGPGLAMVGVGFTALGGGLVAFGVGAGTAAVGFGALALATRSVGRLKGSGLAGVVEMLITDLEPLEGLAPRLRPINRSLGLVVDFLVEFSKVGALLLGLGGAALFADFVDGFLEVIGVGSPLDHLAQRSMGMADTVELMLGNFERLARFTPDSLRGITGTLRMLIGFMGDYARLSEAIDELPGGGVFARIGEAIGGLFGSDSPAERLAEQSGPIVAAMERLLSRFSQLQQLTQPRAPTPANPAQIRDVVQATLAKEAEADLGDKLDEQTKLLEKMLAVLQEQRANERTRPQPSTRSVRGPSGGSDFTRGAAGGAY